MDRIKAWDLYTQAQYYWSSTLKNLRSWHLVPSLHGKLKRGKWKQWQILFSWAPKSLQTVTAVTKLKDACSLEESYDKPRQCIKKQRHHFVDKGPYCQSYGFSGSQVQMWKLDCKEGWALKNAFELWCWRRLLRIPWTARSKWLILKKKKKNK